MEQQATPNGSDGSKPEDAFFAAEGPVPPRAAKQDRLEVVPDTRTPPPSLDDDGAVVLVTSGTALVLPGRCAICGAEADGTESITVTPLREAYERLRFKLPLCDRCASIGSGPLMRVLVVALPVTLVAALVVSVPLLTGQMSETMALLGAIVWAAVAVEVVAFAVVALRGRGQILRETGHRAPLITAVQPNGKGHVEMRLRLGSAVFAERLVAPNPDVVRAADDANRPPS